MLSGLKILKCAHCGSYMIGTARSSRGKHYTTYSCPRHKEKKCPNKEIRTEYVDNMVAKLLARQLYQRDDLQRISTLMKHTDNGKKLLDKKLGVERAIDNVLKAMETSSSEQLVHRLNALEKEKVSLEKALATNESRMEGITKANCKSVCRAFSQYLLSSDALDTKEYLTGMIGEILISQDTVSIKMKVA